MLVERDWQSITGRWFTGAYDELGLDVDADARRPRADRQRPRSRSRSARAAGQTVRIFGENLPAGDRAARRRLRPRRDGHAASLTSTPGVDDGGRRRRRRCADRRARPVRGRRASRGRARRLRQDRLHQGDARLGHGARRRRGVSEDARAVRGHCVEPRPRRQARHEGRHRPRRRGRHVESSRNTPRRSTTTT